MDYEKKQTGIGMCFMPGGDLAADMKRIMEFYQNIKGKFPDKFLTDERFT
jgi:hypothetical protein